MRRVILALLACGLFAACSSGGPTERRPSPTPSRSTRPLSTDARLRLAILD